MASPLPGDVVLFCTQGRKSSCWKRMACGGGASTAVLQASPVVKCRGRTCILEAGERGVKVLPLQEVVAWRLANDERVTSVLHRRLEIPRLVSLAATSKTLLDAVVGNYEQKPRADSSTVEGCDYMAITGYSSKDTVSDALLAVGALRIRPRRRRTATSWLKPWQKLRRQVPWNDGYVLSEATTLKLGNPAAQALAGSDAWWGQLVATFYSGPPSPSPPAPMGRLLKLPSRSAGSSQSVRSTISSDESPGATAAVGHEAMVCPGGARQLSVGGSGTKATAAAQRPTTVPRGVSLQPMLHASKQCSESAGQQGPSEASVHDPCSGHLHDSAPPLPPTSDEFWSPGRPARLNSWMKPTNGRQRNGRGDGSTAVAPIPDLWRGTPTGSPTPAQSLPIFLPAPHPLSESASTGSSDSRQTMVVSGVVCRMRSLGAGQILAAYSSPPQPQIRRPQANSSPELSPASSSSSYCSGPCSPLPPALSPERSPQPRPSDAPYSSLFTSTEADLAFCSVADTSMESEGGASVLTSPVTVGIDARVAKAAPSAQSSANIKGINETTVGLGDVDVDVCVGVGADGDVHADADGEVDADADGEVDADVEVDAEVDADVDVDVVGTSHSGGARAAARGKGLQEGSFDPQHFGEVNKTPEDSAQPALPLSTEQVDEASTIISVAEASEHSPECQSGLLKSMLKKRAVNRVMADLSPFLGDLMHSLDQAEAGIPASESNTSTKDPIGESQASWDEYSQTPDDGRTPQQLQLKTKQKPRHSITGTTPPRILLVQQSVSPTRPLPSSSSEAHPHLERPTRTASQPVDDVMSSVSRIPCISWQNSSARRRSPLSSTSRSSDAKSSPSPSPSSGSSPDGSATVKTSSKKQLSCTPEGGVAPFADSSAQNKSTNPTSRSSGRPPMSARYSGSSVRSSSSNRSAKRSLFRLDPNVPWSASRSRPSGIPTLKSASSTPKHPASYDCENVHPTPTQLHTPKAGAGAGTGTGTETETETATGAQPSPHGYAGITTPMAFTSRPKIPLTARRSNRDGWTPRTTTPKTSTLGSVLRAVPPSNSRETVAKHPTGTPAQSMSQNAHEPPVGISTPLAFASRPRLLMTTRKGHHPPSLSTLHENEAASHGFNTDQSPLPCALQTPMVVSAPSSTTRDERRTPAGSQAPDATDHVKPSHGDRCDVGPAATTFYVGSVRAKGVRENHAMTPNEPARFQEDQALPMRTTPFQKRLLNALVMEKVKCQP